MTMALHFTVCDLEGPERSMMWGDFFILIVLGVCASHTEDPQNFSFYSPSYSCQVILCLETRPRSGAAKEEPRAHKRDLAPGSNSFPCCLSDLAASVPSQPLGCLLGLK